MAETGITLRGALARAAVVAVAVAAAAPAHAEPRVAAAPNPGYAALRAVVFEPPGGPVPPQTAPQLSNGEVVNVRDYPALAIETIPGGRPDEPVRNCTAALIGPATVLLAAHCLDWTMEPQFVFVGLPAVRSVCVVAPEYATDRSIDLALCALEHAIEDIPYERIELGPKPAAGASVILTGFGCTTPGTPSDWQLRVGFSSVIDQPGRDVVNVGPEPDTIFTRTPGGEGAVICQGDSGGPLWLPTGAGRTQRVIVGAVSRTVASTGTSLFAALGSPQARAFFATFVARGGASICGINRILGCLS